jgi:hypothetical protein
LLGVSPSARLAFRACERRERGVARALLFTRVRPLHGALQLGFLQKGILNMKFGILVLASSFVLGGCIYRNEVDDDGYGGNSYGGSSYSRPCTGGSTSSGGASSTGGSNTGGIVEPPPPPPPECLELTTEEACTERADCTPIYAGTDCTCGPDCTCIGGEPGCVCETYGFLVCVDAETAE